MIPVDPIIYYLARASLTGSEGAKWRARSRRVHSLRTAATQVRHRVFLMRFPLYGSMPSVNGYMNWGLPLGVWMLRRGQGCRQRNSRRLRLRRPPAEAHDDVADCALGATQIPTALLDLMCVNACSSAANAVGSAAFARRPLGAV